MTDREVNPRTRYPRKEAESNVDERTLELQRANEILKAENIELKLAEKRLISSERKYTTIFNNAQDTIFVATDGTFTDCNPKTILRNRVTTTISLLIASLSTPPLWHVYSLSDFPDTPQEFQRFHLEVFSHYGAFLEL
ncbi:MAG: hypothetical protein OEV08_09655 [Nitrospira sp.]|nr:hypothetical protein [Nitrospira sp.]